MSQVTSDPIGNDVAGNSAGKSFWVGGDFSAWISWQILAAIAIALIANLTRLGVPIWSMSPDPQWFLVYLAIAHVLGALALTRRVEKRGRASLVDVLLAASVAYGVLYVLLRVPGEYLSRSVLVIAFGLSLGAFSVSLSVIRRLLPVLLVVVGGIVTLAWGEMPDGLVLSSTLYPLRSVVHPGVVPSEVTGGSIEEFGGGLLAVAGDGALFILEEKGAARTIIPQPLRDRVPLNLQAFRSDVPVTPRLRHFRVADLLIEDVDGRVRLFASHDYWNSETGCLTIRVSTAEAPRAGLLSGQAQLAWQTVFETQPCVPINRQTNLDEVGGRMIRLDDETILLTVGDVGFNGVGSDQTLLTESPGSSYGKTIRIDLKTRTAGPYTTGHRNPQGLHRTTDGLIWATEHGPKGGDELNLIKEGTDYGWPNVTYGANYGNYVWPRGPEPERHTGYQRPVYAWLPSIGVSGIIRIERDLFPNWKGDLLVASLRQETLFRLRMSEGMVVYSEPIPVGRRVRDLVEASDGRIVLLQDDGAVTFLEPTAPPPSWLNRCKPPFVC